MARTNPWRETGWDEMPPRPKYNAPEAKYFLMIDQEITETARLQCRDDRALYAYMLQHMTRAIAEHMLRKHEEELRQGITGMVLHRNNFYKWTHEVQMGVYVLTPQEMDSLKAEIIREYQEREKTYS